MKAAPLPKPRPSIITALELVGLDDPTMAEGRALQVFAVVARHLGDPELAVLFGSYLTFTGRRVLHVAPIKRGGMLPFWLALTMVHLQSDLIPLGVLMRGAIALGPVAVRGELSVGQGITEAQGLCDEVALVPRVIVDPRLLREVERNTHLRAPHHAVMDELGYLRTLLRLDADGLWFVDYLWALKSEVDVQPEYLDFFKYHRLLLTRKLEASTVLDSASRAATWLWRYHDLVLGELKTAWRISDQELAELRIAATSPLVYRFPPSAKAP